MTTAPLKFDKADLLAFLAMLVGTEGGLIRSSSTDPSKVQTPGVWVRVNQIRRSRLAGGSDVDMTLFPVVGDTDWDTAYQVLLPVLDELLAVLNQIGGPTGPIVPTALVLQGSSTGLPAFSVPFTLHTTTEE